MWRLRILFLVSCLSSPCFAGFRISGGLGLGATTTSQEVSESEGPLTQMYTIETVVHSRLLTGAEHLRSLQMSPISTAISFTGLFFQSYFTSLPTPYVKAENLSSEMITFRDYGFFVGAGIGLGQSSRMPDVDGKSSNAAGIYLSPRVGFDMQMTKGVGLRSSLMIAMTLVGQGSLMSTSVLETIYWAF